MKLRYRPTKTYISRSDIKEPITYKIVDNGDKPWRVTITPTKITINTFKTETEDYKWKDYTKLIQEIDEFEGYWTGYDSRELVKHIDWSGNSLLIKIDENTYTSIGYNIYTFRTNEKIIDYLSPMGNNDVSYPVAIGENNVYFMMDHQTIKTG